MSMRDAAVDAFLSLIAEKGFSSVTLRDVAVRAGVGLGDLYRLYPDKAALIASFIARIDTAVLAAVTCENDGEETARDRLFDVMMQRYEALRAERPAWRELRRALLRDPLLALAVAPAIRRSMAAMLEGAGIASDGLAGALRQNALALLHFEVARTFDRDETGDLSKTMVALDGRLKMAERWAQMFENKRFSRQERSVEAVPPAA